MNRGTLENERKWEKRVKGGNRKKIDEREE